MLSYLSAIHVHLQSQGQKLPPLGMPETQTVAGTDNRSGGNPPVLLVIQALDHVTLNTSHLGVLYHEQDSICNV